jgi:hypothetical protein
MEGKKPFTQKDLQTLVGLTEAVDLGRLSLLRFMGVM